MNFSNLEIRSTAMSNLQNIAYFAYGKIILLSMLTGADGSVRGRAVDEVLHIRQYEDNTGRGDETMFSSAHITKVRKFKIPKIDEE